MRSSWLSVCKELARLTDEIAEKGTAYIPEVGFEEFVGMGEEGKKEMREKGCFVIRGVIPQKQAEGWFDDLKMMVEENEGKITGYCTSTAMQTNTPMIQSSHTH